MPWLVLCLLAIALAPGCATTDPHTELDTRLLTIRAECSGNGETTVFLLPGLSGKSSTWQEVINLSSQLTRICAVDFFPKEKLVTGQDIAEALSEFNRLDQTAQDTILVAHSFGGYVAQLYFGITDVHVSGIVLVDSSHPDMLAAYAPLVSAESLQSMQDFVASNPNTIDLVRTEEQVREVTGFGDAPLIVLSRGKPGHIADLSDAENQSVDQAWAILQAQLSGLSTISQQITVVNAGHNIPQEAPAVIATAIGQLLANQ